MVADRARRLEPSLTYRRYKVTARPVGSSSAVASPDRQIGNKARSQSQRESGPGRDRRAHHRSHESPSPITRLRIRRMTKAKARRSRPLPCQVPRPQPRANDPPAVLPRKASSTSHLVLEVEGTGSGVFYAKEVQ